MLRLFPVGGAALREIVIASKLTLFSNNDAEDKSTRIFLQHSVFTDILFSLTTSIFIANPSFEYVTQYML